jgi:cobalt-zinc-cadmium efflux system protein
VHILAEGVPEGLTVGQVAEVMGQVPGVSEVHDLHVWTVGPGYVALSAHVVLDDRSLSQTQAVMDGLKASLRQRFGIEHTTVQFECGNCGQGSVACDNGKP